MDNRHLCVGSTIFYPVAVKGALFSCGDGHAAQGEGEVAGSAIETGMHVRMRLTVLKKGAPGNWGASILEPGRVLMATPRYITPDPATVYKAGPQFGVSGVNDDLLV